MNDQQLNRANSCPRGQSARTETVSPTYNNHENARVNISNTDCCARHDFNQTAGSSVDRQHLSLAQIKKSPENNPGFG
ncbi:MAG: hypothetical protein PVH43_02500 [Desulfobacterales bacterium]|jgi:hypothetical protein